MLRYHPGPFFLHYRLAPVLGLALVLEQVLVLLPVRHLRQSCWQLMLQYHPDPSFLHYPLAPVLGLGLVQVLALLPAAFLLGMWIPPVAFRVLLRCMLILFGCLYILDFRVKKPKMWLLSLLAAVYLIPMTLILLRK